MLLELKNIFKSFGGTRVLQGIGLDVAEGEFITLLGPSGCGKTTTLRIIAGLEQPDSGSVVLDGQDVTGLPPNERPVNTVFQNYALFPHMNVEANVGYSLRLRKLPKDDIKKTVTDALALVQLPGYGRRMPSELSGGQSQRVAIARAVVAQPKVLLLDEPLGALDLQLRRQMQLELKGLQKRLGITFIYITHDQEEALSMSDRIAVMRGGRFEQIGSAADIYDRPRTAYVAKFVGNANIIGGALMNRPGRTLAVRSEYIELTPASSCGTAPLAGVVRDKSFAGGQLRIAVILPDGTEVIASRHGIDSPLTPGERVRVFWPEEKAVEVIEN